MIRRGIAPPTLNDDDRKARDKEAGRELERLYRFRTTDYITEKLGWTPWAGADGLPGQQEVIDAYELALRQQIERDEWEQGEKTTEELEWWQPGQVIQNELRIEAGHTVGKTKLSSGLVNHFFDCFSPSIIYTFAPSWVQIHDLLWKEIKADRRGKGLPGRILDLRLEIDDNHFATGKATSDNGGRGTERVQGQHGKYLMFILDEAEGVPDFVWSAVDSMMGGGIGIVLMLANPKTRSSKFHKRRTQPTCKTFRISCLNHPNVREGREVVPGAVRRGFVEKLMQSDDSRVEVVKEHNPDEHTFSLNFPVVLGDVTHGIGTIFKPIGQFCWRVLGVAPKNASVNTFCPPGRFEAATQRKQADALTYNVDANKVRVGVDVSRYGDDYGTVYVRHNGRVFRGDQVWHADTATYMAAIRDALVALVDHCSESGEDAPDDCEIRVDGSGGFGAGVIDGLKDDPQLKGLFPTFNVVEVHFASSASDPTKYADIVTEMYGESAESIKGLAIENPPAQLDSDICDRPFKYINVGGVSVKKLVPKDEFKTKFGRSPDDGDGFVLCVAPDFVFDNLREVETTYW